MITNSAPWDNLKFDEDGVKEVVRTFFGKLYQTYSFFTMYANVDNFDVAVPQLPLSERPEIDRWILSELNTLIKEVTAAYESYEPTRAGRMISSFVTDSLSNWFVRLNRKRFWSGEMDNNKLSAYQTLYLCLKTVAQLMAPIAPFYADRLYKDLTAPCEGAPESVHLSRFPKADETLINKPLETNMQLAQRITSLVLSLRKKEHIIVRQPLQRISISVSSGVQRDGIETVRQLILDETNVKELEFVDGAVSSRKVKCNFRVMGKKYGKLMKAVAATMDTLTPEQITALENEGTLSLALPEAPEPVVVDRNDVEIVSEDIPGWTVANDGNLTVALDIEITEELKREGVARELVKRIQTYRKESGFEITDHICVKLSPNAELEAVLAAFGDYMSAQVLADKFEMGEVADDAPALELEDLNVKSK